MTSGAPAAELSNLLNSAGRICCAVGTVVTLTIPDAPELCARAVETGQKMTSAAEIRTENRDGIGFPRAIAKAPAYIRLGQASVSCLGGRPDRDRMGAWNRH